MKNASRVFGSALLAVVALTTATALRLEAHERPRAEIACQPSGDRLTYDCVIELTGRTGGAPIDDAEITIFADMPSMPMAHNVPPVRAEKAGAAGVYRARLRLEMPGTWVLRLRISGSAPDVFVKWLGFGAAARGARHGAYEGYRERYAGHADQGDDVLVGRGKSIYDDYCAACHGAGLEGELASGATVPEGETPAPPLNGSAHSYHHADGELFGVVRDGPGSSRAGRPQRMPAFGRVLPDADIWAAIAYLKSVWPKRVQRRHARSFPPPRRAGKAVR